MVHLQTLAALVHIVGTALWIGAMVFFLVVLGPAVHDLEPRLAIQILNRGRIGFETISWIAIALLLITGVFNLLLRLSASAVAVGEFYAIVLTIKLIVVAAMIVHHCLQAFKYAPAISSLTAQPLQASDLWPEPLLSRWRRWFFLLKINAALGPVVVLLGLNLKM